MDIDISGPFYSVHRGDTLHILIGSSGIAPLQPGTMADGISFGGGDDDGEQTMSYRNRYHQQPTLASRRHSEHNVMSPTAMTISGTGWNATWRSAHSGRPPAPVQKSPGELKYILLN